MSAKVRRWIEDDAAPELQRALASAELDQPSSAQLSRLEAKLETALGPELSAAASGGHVAQPNAAGGTVPAAGAAAPVLAVATALVLGLGAAWFGFRSEPAATPLPQAQAKVATAPAPEPQAPAAPAIIELEPDPVVAAPAPVAEERAPAQPRRAATRLERPLGLSEELRQLEVIRRQLPTNPERALGATDRHARRFPQGALGPERALLRIEALLRLGRGPEARRLATRELADKTPYRAQILQLIAALPEPQ